MFRTIIAAGLVAAAAPAIAQDAAPMPTPTPTPAPAEGVTAPPADADIRVQGNPEQQRLVDKSVPTVVATRGDIEFAIDAEWNNFDKDRNNELDEMEFAWFMKKIRETAGNTAETTAEVGRLNAATLAEADIDNNGTVDRNEMISLLQTEG